jgi:ubiquinone/menaquinone biosynthesis C-methylase UbiE
MKEKILKLIVKTRIIFKLQFLINKSFILRKFFSHLFREKLKENEVYSVHNNYDEWYYTRPQAMEYLQNAEIWKNLTNMIQKMNPVRVLDFGCGLGNVIDECQKRYLNVIGVETSDYAIAHNLNKKNIIKIAKIPEAKLPFKDNTFDLVFSTEVMEHIEEKNTDAVIKELYRVCSNQALFTINTFDYNQPGHINMHSRKWWMKKFKNNGFVYNKKMWKSLNKMKYLNWDIYVFKKN